MNVASTKNRLALGLLLLSFWSLSLLLLSLTSSSALAEEDLQETLPDVREVLNQGETFLQQGQQEEAIALYERTSATLAAAHTEDPQSVVPAAFSVLLNELALLDLAYRDGANAESLYRRSLTLAEQAFGEEHPNVAASMFNLAGVVAENGQTEEAITLHRKTLAIWSRELGQDHQQTRLVREELALLQSARNAATRGAGHPSDALNAAAIAVERAAQLRRQAGQDLEQNRPVLAELRYQQALDLYATHAPTHPAVSTVLEEVSVLYIDTGNLDEPEERWQQALVRAAEALPPQAAPLLEDMPPLTAPPQEARPEPTPAVAATPPQLAISQPTPPATGPVYWAQIASRPSLHEADLELKRCRELYPDLLRGHLHRFEEVDLGERGIWHRIQLGPLDRATSRRLCSDILAAGYEDCLVVRER